jgi:hypothetical protein
MSHNRHILPQKIQSALKNAGKFSEKEVIFLDDEELLKIPGIGKASLTKIRKSFGSSLVDRNIQEQCKLLNMPCFTFSLPKLGKEWISPITGKGETIEKAVLDSFSLEGWEGYIWDFEGAPMLNLIDAASIPYRWSESGLDTYSKRIQKVDGTGIEIITTTKRLPYISYWEWKNDLHRKFGDLVEPSASIDENLLKSAIGFLLRKDHVSQWEKKQNFLISLWKLIGKERFRRILEIQYGGEQLRYVAGWPDLVLIRPDQFVFVEVKSITDKLHWSQIRLFKEVSEKLALPWNVAIVHPIPIKAMS